MLLPSKSTMLGNKNKKHCIIVISSRFHSPSQIINEYQQVNCNRSNRIKECSFHYFQKPFTISKQDTTSPAIHNMRELTLFSIEMKQTLSFNLDPIAQSTSLILRLINHAYQNYLNTFIKPFLRENLLFSGPSMFVMKPHLQQELQLNLYKEINQ